MVDKTKNKDIDTKAKESSLKSDKKISKSKNVDELSIKNKKNQEKKVDDDDTKIVNKEKKIAVSKIVSEDNKKNEKKTEKKVVKKPLVITKSTKNKEVEGNKELIESNEVTDGKKRRYIEKKEENIDLTNKHKEKKVNLDLVSDEKEKTNIIISVLDDLRHLVNNFLHWLLSKFIIYLYGFGLSLLVSLPFILIYFFLTNESLLNIYTNFFTGISINTFDSFVNNILYTYEAFGYVILLILSGDFTNVIYILGGILFVFMFLYINNVLISLSNSYFDGHKLSLKLYSFFKVSKIIKFFKLLLVNLFASLITLVPLIIYITIVYIIRQLMGGADKIGYDMLTSNVYIVTTFTYFFLCIIFGIYVFYRLVFSFFVFADKSYDQKNISILGYVKEGFVKTKSIKKFFKFLLLNIIIFVITLPAYIFATYIFSNAKYLTDYNSYIGYSEDKKADIIKQKEGKYYSFLDMKYNGISKEKINDEYKKFNIYKILFFVFDFVFLYGIYVMLYAGFYRRELD